MMGFIEQFLVAKEQRLVTVDLPSRRPSWVTVRVLQPSSHIGSMIFNDRPAGYGGKLTKHAKKSNLSKIDTSYRALNGEGHPFAPQNAVHRLTDVTTRSAESRLRHKTAIRQGLLLQLPKVFPAY